MTAPARAPVFGAEVQRRLLGEFQRAQHVPAYRTLLEESGVRAEQVVDLHAFTQLCPLLSKRNTFDRFPPSALSVGGTLRDVAEVLTSSGHGGRFSFGLISRSQASSAPAFVDAGLDGMFGVRSRRTLAINCLPMGVVLSSNCMTVATTSVREDMAVALLRAFGEDYEQVLLIGDPLFMKRLADYAVEQGVDWSRYRLGVVVGEEIFGEHFRSYLGDSLALDLDASDAGRIVSSFGVGELGLNLCYETAATIALRRACFRRPELTRELLGADEGGPLPMLFSFDPLRTFIESVEPNTAGYGQLTISMLDSDQLVPLLRYQTGDVIRLLDTAVVANVLRKHGVAGSHDLPGALLALQGRMRERLPNGSHSGVYKDALYAEPRIAASLTGACRLIFSGRACTMHVQMARGANLDGSAEAAIIRAIPAAVRPSQVALWPYERFPFGMGLDFERKFTYHVPGESEPTGFEPGRPFSAT